MITSALGSTASGRGSNEEFEHSVDLGCRLGVEPEADGAPHACAREYALFYEQVLFDGDEGIETGL